MERGVQWEDANASKLHAMLRDLPGTPAENCKKCIWAIDVLLLEAAPGSRYHGVLKQIRHVVNAMILLNMHPYFNEEEIAVHALAA